MKRYESKQALPADEQTPPTWTQTVRNPDSGELETVPAEQKPDEKEPVKKEEEDASNS